MYTKTQIAEIRARAIEYGLTYPQSFLAAQRANLCTVCNGIGAEWMSERSRKIITKMLDYAECSAAVHDYEYSLSDGDEKRRKSVDELFLMNGLREVRAKYPHWYGWRRWLGERAVLAAHEILTRTGSLAWRDAFASRVLAEFKKRGITAKQFFEENKK